MLKDLILTYFSDAGSADDKGGNTKLGSKSRVVAYLTARFGNNGKQQCSVIGDPKTSESNTNFQIDYLIASHPHEDHISHMLSALECFNVKEFWEPGILHPTEGYQKLRNAVLTDPAILYKAAVQPFCLKDSTRCTVKFSPNNTIKLGTRTSAKATILHVGTQKASSPNSYSIVLRLDLGGASLLLTGDAESGARAPTNSNVGHIEKYLIEHFKTEIDVDILQIGHHGSLTSSRDIFINTVSPRLALISSGPKKYGSVILPDSEVIIALARFGIQTINTNLHDNIGCPVEDKIGTNEKRSPGGCDNYVLTITPQN